MIIPEALRPRPPDGRGQPLADFATPPRFPGASFLP